MQRIRELSLLSCYELVKQYIGGNSDAFGVHYGRCYGFVRNVCRNIVHDKTILPDLVQTTFLNALRRISSFRPTSGHKSFKKWMWRIATNTSISYYRSVSKDKKATRKAFEGEIISNPSRGPNPGRAAEKRERRDILLHAVKGLPQSTRECIEAYYFRGFSYADICEAFGLTKQQVTGELYKGRRVLEAKIRKWI